MTVPTNSYSDVSNTNLGVGKPGLSADWVDMNTNTKHLKEVLYGTYTAAVEHDHDGVNSALVSSVANGAIGEDQLANGAVHTAKLSTTSETLATPTGGASHFFLSANSTYCFFPRFRSSLAGSNTHSAQLINNITGSTLGVADKVLLYMSASGSTILYGTFKFVQSSPPHKLAGRENWGLFLQMVRDKYTKEVGACSISEEPAWAGNWSPLPKNHPSRMEQLSHPFADYYHKPLPENLEIVLVDLQDFNELVEYDETAEKIAYMESIGDDSEFLDIEKDKHKEERKRIIAIERKIELAKKDLVIVENHIRKNAPKDKTPEEVDYAVDVYKGRIEAHKRRLERSIDNRVPLHKKLELSPNMVSFHDHEAREVFADYFAADNDISDEEKALLPDGFKNKVRIVRK